MEGGELAPKRYLLVLFQHEWNLFHFTKVQTFSIRTIFHQSLYFNFENDTLSQFQLLVTHTSEVFYIL